MRTAIVHEWITGWVGSEKVTGALAEIFPEAPVYVTVVDPKVLKGTPLEGREVRGSFLQGWPGAVRGHRWLLGLMPVAVEQHDLSEFELVISSSHAVAHGAIVPAHALHVCYCHTPMRYAWDLSARYAQEAGSGIKGLLWRLVMHRLRVWDEASSSRVDAWVANSRYVAERVRRWYGVADVAVVHPPVAVERFDPSQDREGYYLTAGRLVGYKRVDLAVRACAETGRELVVAGDGPERKRLEAEAAGSGARVGWTETVEDGSIGELVE
ncbi:MAG: glycosyltransferase, partial [Planctomycetota bacterium]